MTSTISAKKGTGLDDLFEEYTPQQLEEQKNSSQSQIDYPLLVQKYKGYLGAELLGEHILAQSGYLQQENRLLEILTPPEISAFLTSLLPYEDHEEFSNRTGHFVNKLIQNSYDARMNDFTLDISVFSSPVHTLAGALAGTAQKPLVMQVKGYLGEGYAVGANYIDLTACGKPGMRFSHDSAHCRFTIDSIWDNGFDFDNAWQEGDTVYAENNVYQTSDYGTALDLKRELVLMKHCKIIFIDHEGNEQIIGES